MAMGDGQPTDNAMSDEAVARDSVTDEAVTDEAVTDEAMADDVVSDKAVSDKAVSDEAVSDEAAYPDLSGLSYEQARDELVSIVARLEGGHVPLEQAMDLWHRGEALAAHCSAWLDGAQARIAAAAPEHRRG